MGDGGKARIVGPVEVSIGGVPIRGYDPGEVIVLRSEPREDAQPPRQYVGVIDMYVSGRQLLDALALMPAPRGARVYRSLHEAMLDFGTPDQQRRARQWFKRRARMRRKQRRGWA